MDETYFEQVRSKDSFAKLADNAPNFEQFRGKENPPAVSSWGRDALIACRVLCEKERDKLPLLARILPSQEELQTKSSALRHLTSYVGDITTPTEGDLVWDESDKHIGSVWAALARLRVKSVALADALAAADAHRSPRPVRKTSVPEKYGSYVNPQDYRFESSSPISHDPPSSQDSRESSGYIDEREQITRPLEAVAVRLITAFVKCVLTHSQRSDPASNASPVYDPELEAVTRHEPLICVGFTPLKNIRIVAADDGGIQLSQKDEPHVAAIEAKRGLDEIVDGKPEVSDRLLAQVVGEALALKVASHVQSVSPTEFVTIIAQGQYVRLVSMTITEDLIATLEGPPADGEGDVTLEDAPAEVEDDADLEDLPTDTQHDSDDADDELFLRVRSSKLFDLGDANGRLQVARHIIALARWGNAQNANGGATL